MIVKELMSTNIYFAKIDATIADVAALMKQYDIGFVPICDNKGCLLGVVTDRDIVLHSKFAKISDFQSLPISEVMSSNIIAVNADMNVHDAACMFSEKKVRRLPVLESGKLTGVLTLSDLARKKLFLAEVGDIMGHLATSRK